MRDQCGPKGLRHTKPCGPVGTSTMCAMGSHWSVSRGEVTCWDMDFGSLTQNAMQGIDY